MNQRPIIPKGEASTDIVVLAFLAFIVFAFALAVAGV